MESSIKDRLNSIGKSNPSIPFNIQNTKDLDRLLLHLKADAQINEHEREEKNKDLKSYIVRLGIKFTPIFFAVALAIWLVLGLFPSCSRAIELSKRLWLVISNISELFIGALIGKLIGF